MTHSKTTLSSPAKSTGWTPQREALLRQLWRDGVSTKEIAQQIGTTKDAVVGKAKRLKLGMHKQVATTGYFTKRRKKELEPPLLKADRGEPWRGCRWIEGEPSKDVAICGKRLARHLDGRPSSYCAEHHPRVWEPADEKLRRRARDFRKRSALVA